MGGRTPSPPDIISLRKTSGRYVVFQCWAYIFNWGVAIRVQHLGEVKMAGTRRPYGGGASAASVEAQAPIWWHECDIRRIKMFDALVGGSLYGAWLRRAWKSGLRRYMACRRRWRRGWQRACNRSGKRTRRGEGRLRCSDAGKIVSRWYSYEGTVEKWRVWRAITWWVGGLNGPDRLVDTNNTMNEEQSLKGEKAAKAEAESVVVEMDVEFRSTYKDLRDLTYLRSLFHDIPLDD